jgi:uncharacterized protein Yka (UPF0111/DUF47 family)
MKLRLFPRQEDAYFPLFEAAADTIGAAATVLLDLLSDLSDPEAKAKQLAELEHQGDRITRTILTQLASTLSPASTATTSLSWPNGSTT